ncbi:MAG TPA: hypothetical protein VFL91_17905 [Thermomicrobiales bacterium]|nr:hypothetical protein [Thermomicrobiales bacterium]
MRQILYALQFLGRATAERHRPGVLVTTAFAPSCRVTTTIGPDGVAGAVEPVAGERATCEAAVGVDAAGRAWGAATVTFGAAGHRLHLRLLGHTGLDGGAPARSSLVWEVERGEGQFAGAAGLIASHLVVGDAGEVVDTQIGVIALASPRGRRGPGGAA